MESRNVEIRMPKSATSVWTLSYVKRTFVSVDERWSWTYVIYAIRSVNNCRGGQGLNDGLNDLLGAPEERCETYGEVESGLLVIGKIERKGPLRFIDPLYLFKRKCRGSRSYLYFREANVSTCTES